MARALAAEQKRGAPFRGHIPGRMKRSAMRSGVQGQMRLLWVPDPRYARPGMWTPVHPHATIVNRGAAEGAGESSPVST